MSIFMLDLNLGTNFYEHHSRNSICSRNRMRSNHQIRYTKVSFNFQETKSEWGEIFATEIFVVMRGIERCVYSIKSPLF